MKVENNILEIGGRNHEFGNTIDDYIEFEDLVVVLLGLTGEDYPEIKQNVIGVGKDGEQRWKIEKAPEEGYYDAYVGIDEQDGELIAHNLSGMSYTVDLETGDIDDGTFVK